MKHLFHHPSRNLMSFVRTVVMGALLSAPGYSLTGTGGFDSPYFQADYVQDLTSYSSAFINPALLYRVNQMHVQFGFYRWGLEANISSLGYQVFSFLYPFRLNHTFGLSLIGPGTPAINKTTLDPNDPDYVKGDPFQSKRKVRYGDMWVVGNYGMRLLPYLMLGTNLKYRYVNQFGETRQHGIGLDIGTYFNPMDHYRFGDVGLSLTLQDILPAGIWPEMEWEETKKQLNTTRLRVGLRYAVFNDKLIFSGEGVLDNAFSDMYKGMMDITDRDSLKKVIRGSFHTRMQFIYPIWLKAGWTNNYMPYVGMNYNFIYPLPQMINLIHFDVHMGYSLLETDRGFTLMSKLSSDFGPTREQLESRRLYGILILAPMNDYNEAMRLYLAGKYWLASFAFGKVIALYPTFHLNDQAAYYMGNCYRFLHLNDIARQTYSEALKEYPTSETRSKYLYGLQNIDYREGKYEEALKNHAFIINLYGDSEIRSDADYLAGQIHFQRKNYNVAEQLFRKIGPDNPTYPFAQYTLSIIHVINKRPQEAIACLQGIVKDSATSPAEFALHDAAHTKLGHLYFEEVELRKAVEQYQRVPDGSIYGDEALLGTAWSWIKVQQMAYCLQACDRLIASHPKSPFIPEAHLLKGYALMLTKDYNDAVKMFEKCLELTKGKFITERDMQYRRTQYGQFLQKFQPVAQYIKKNALRKPTERSLAERTELHAEFDKFDKESRDYFEFVLQADAHKKFLRQKERIVADAEYALATAYRLLKTRKQEDILKDQKKKEEKIDDEIEKLQKELQELNE